MISLERVNPASPDHIDRYLEMLSTASRSAEIQTHLPEIFEEGSGSRIQKGIRANGALRFFVIVEGNVAGRVELTRHLNTDPSITDRIPEGVNLGLNTCYFAIPELISRNTEQAHAKIADASIRQAFLEGDLAGNSSPWLPVSLDGTDVSRGWLLQSENTGYDVHVGDPQDGIFPQFGIGDNLYSLVYATPKVSA